MPESIFSPHGDTYIPTEAAISPWSREMLHGSAPAMLLARELEAFPADRPMLVARLTIELLRPVGLVPLSLRSRLLRPGRKVQLLEASLLAGEQEVVRATALRIRQEAIVLPDLGAEPPPHQPESVPVWEAPGYGETIAYHNTGAELRVPAAQVGRLGPAFAWIRLKLPLLPGEEPSPLVRICAAADFGNGISNVVDPRRFLYVNPDLSIHIHRLPAGEWVGLEARSWLQPQGNGMAEGLLWDGSGPLGRSVQSLLVEAR